MSAISTTSTITISRKERIKNQNKMEATTMTNSTNTTITISRSERIANQKLQKGKVQKVEKTKSKKKEKSSKFLTLAVSLLKGRMLKAMFALAAVAIVSASYSHVSMAAGDDDYFVKEGDTLSSIAAYRHVTKEQLKMKNGLTSDKISVGEHLIVPMVDSKGNQVPELGPEAFDPNIHMHVIRSGDTYEKLAKIYHVTVKSIYDANPYVNPNKLRIGNLLSIDLSAKTVSNSTINSSATTATKPVTGSKPTTTVSKPVTSTAPSKTVENSTKGVSKPTSSTKSSETVANPTATTVSSVETVAYKIEGGDNLGILAKRFSSTVNELEKINKLKNDVIYAGEKLQIPSRNTIWTKATVLGAEDNSTVEFTSHYVTLDLKVSNGASKQYNKLSGREEIVTFTKGSTPALISMVDAN